MSPVSLDALSAGVRWSPLEALQLEVAQAQARAAHAEAKAEALRALRHFRPAGWMIWVHRKMRQTDPFAPVLTGSVRATRELSAKCPRDGAAQKLLNK